MDINSSELQQHRSRESLAKMRGCIQRLEFLDKLRSVRLRIFGP